MIFLNETAATILEMLDAQTPDNALVEQVARHYAIEMANAERDYAEILSVFAALQVTVPIDEQNAAAVTNGTVDQEDESDPRDELKVYRAENGVPLQCFIELTAACNLECSHCYIPKKAPRTQLSINEYKCLISELRDLGCLELS